MKSFARSIAGLSVFGLLAFNASLADAGGGMGAGSGITTCRAVSNAAQQPQTIALTDSFGNSTVVVATAAFICDLPATGATVKGTQTVAGPTQDECVGTIVPGEANAVTCYTVRPDTRTRLATTTTDAFGPQQPVNVGGVQLLCVPSIVPLPATQ